MPIINTHKLSFCIIFYLWHQDIIQNITGYSKKHREALEVADATVRQILYNMYKVPTLAAEPQDTMAPNDSGDNSGGAQKTWVLPKITITYYHEPRKDRKFRRGELIASLSNGIHLWKSCMISYLFM